MNSLPRRDFVKLTLAATATRALSLEAKSIDSAAPRGNLIDCNVNISSWPTRRLQNSDTEQLVRLLRRHHVTQAWVGSFDALLHKDLAAVNAHLADECRHQGHGMFVPFGSVNPNSPDWEEELRRCVEVYHMPGIRLHPNYHRYKLNDPAFARLLRLAAERNLIVQLAVLMEDERMMHPLLRVEPVDLTPLTALVQQTSGVRLVLLNALGNARIESLLKLVNSGEVYVEISMLEGVGAVEKLISQIRPERVLFGSYAPFFYFESALFKLQESDLAQENLSAIQHQNASRLLAKTL